MRRRVAVRRRHAARSLGPFEEVQSENGRVEVVTEVAFQYCFDVTNDCTGSNRVVWDGGG